MSTIRYCGALRIRLTFLRRGMIHPLGAYQALSEYRVHIAHCSNKKLGCMTVYIGASKYEESNSSASFDDVAQEAMKAANAIVEGGFIASYAAFGDHKYDIARQPKLGLWSAASPEIRAALEGKA